MAKKKETVQSVAEQTKQEEIIPEIQKEQSANSNQEPDLIVVNEGLKSENDTLRSENCELRTMLSEQKTPEYLVVIPYKKSEAQGNELLLAIRGWIKHFKEAFRIIIVGDHPGEIPEELPENMSVVIHLPHVCQTETPPLDIIAKLQEVIAAYPEYPGIILTNDDIYPVNDFDITEVKLLKSDGLLTDRKSTGDLYSENRAQTLKLLQAGHLPVYDYDCHTPVYLDTAKLLELIEKFDMTGSASLLASLYFNYFYPERIPLKLDLQYDNLKVGVHRQNANWDLLEEMCRRKIWVNNSVSGWCDQFRKIMEEILS